MKWSSGEGVMRMYNEIIFYNGDNFRIVFVCLNLFLRLFFNDEFVIWKMLI